MQNKSKDIDEMILGIGIDIVETKRIVNLYKKFGLRFAHKILSKLELEYCVDLNEQHMMDFLCGRFAGKEAFLKAIGIGFSNGICWTDMSILNNDLGAPYIMLNASLHKKITNAKKCESFDSFVSISTEKEYCVANVILSQKQHIIALLK